MSNVKVTALRGFRFKGKEVAKGEEVSLPAKTAKAWANVDKVEVSREVEAKIEAQTAKKK